MEDRPCLYVFEHTFRYTVPPLVFAKILEYLERTLSKTVKT